MRRALALALLVVAACAFDPQRAIRPARFTVGMNAQRITPAPDPTTVTARTTDGGSAPPSASSNAVAMSGQFTMSTRDHLYLGGEVEAGRLADPGSNLAGAYGIMGAEGVSHVGSLGVELATGWRGVRYTIDSNEVNDAIVQPRVRGQLWVSPQVTLGAAAGATLVGDRGWMAGVYLGVHSSLFGAFH
jgi:hypothetical protein